MTDRDALLRAIIENPADDAPRLVYADWLDEHGDPERAEFIRLTVGLGTPTNGLARRLDQRARDLLARHGERWRSEAPSLRDVKWGDNLFRGFIHQAYLSSWTSFVPVRDKLFATVPLDDLAIDSVTTPACRLLASESRLRRLRSLTLAGPFADAGLTALAACPHLSHLASLYVGGLNGRGARAITDKGGQALLDSPHLRSLRRLYAAGYAFSNKLKTELRARFPEAVV